MNEIFKPSQKTYYIVYNNGESPHFGAVEPNGVMTTPKSELYQTLNRNEWVNKLKSDYNIEVDEKDMPLENV